MLIDRLLAAQARMVAAVRRFLSAYRAGLARFFRRRLRRVRRWRRGWRPWGQCCPRPDIRRVGGQWYDLCVFCAARVRRRPARVAVRSFLFALAALLGGGLGQAAIVLHSRITGADEAPRIEEYISEADWLVARFLSAGG